MTAIGRCGERDAVVLSLLCLLLLLAGPPARAQDPLASCDERVRRAPGVLTSYACYNYVAMQAGLWTEAAARLEGHVAVDPGNTYALGALAYLEKVRGRPRAEELLRRILALQREGGDAPLAERQWTRLELVDFLAQRYRLDEADEVLAEALVDAETHGDAAAPPLVRVNQAWQSWRRAEYGDAWAILREIQDRIFPDGDPHTRSIWLSAMGAVNWAQGAYDAARECYERQAAILAEVGDYFGRVGAMYNIALVATDTGEGETTAALFEQAREAAAAVGNLAVEASALAELAGYTDAATERRALARNGLELARRVNAVDAELSNLRWLAGSLAVEEPRQPEEGRRLLAELETRVGQIGDPVQRANLLALKTKLAWDAAGGPRAGLAERDAAIRIHLGFLAAVEAIRSLQPETLARARTFSRWQHGYASLVTRSLRAHLPAERSIDLAFATMERTRSRLMLEEMDAAHVTAALLDDDDPRVRARRRVLQSIAGVQRELLDPSLDEGSRGGLLERLVRLEYDEETARQEILRSAQRLAALVEPQIPRLEALQDRLSDHEAYLAFQVHAPVGRGLASWDSASHLLVVTRREARAYDLPPAAEIEAAVELFVGLIANRDGSERGAAARRLFDVLLGDALAGLGPAIERLFVSPDGALHRLPFAAVLAAAREDGERAAPTISIVPSAAALVRWSDATSRRPPSGVLGLFDPDLPFDGTAEERGLSGSGGDASRALALWGRRERLPGARAESRAIRRHLGGAVRSVEGGRASERFLRQASLGDYSILHLAAHAVVDELSPQRSFVLLAAGGGDDGLLQAREIPDLDLDGKVVVLSACSGIAGQGIEAEGVISLARAFLVSGARAVVGSLWPLRDDEAARVFGRFYARLAEGRSVDGALATAQRDLARAGVPAAAWGGLLVAGDGRMVPLDLRGHGRSRAGLLALTALAAVVVGVGLGIVVRGRKARPD